MKNMTTLISVLTFSIFSLSAHCLDTPKLSGLSEHTGPDRKVENTEAIAVAGHLVTCSEEGLTAIDLTTGAAKDLPVAGFVVTGMEAEGRRLFLLSGDGRVFTGFLETPETGTFSIDVGAEGGFSFSPRSLAISPGDTVEWEWKSGSHSTTSGNGCAPDGKWDSGILSSGSYLHTFSSVGEFPYFCTPHCGMGMVGSVTVTGNSPLQVVSSSSVSTGKAPLEVFFSAQASGGTGPYAYSWDFGDGSPSAGGSTAAHTYTSEGSYNATVTAADSAGASSIDAHLLITVASSNPQPPQVTSVSKAGNPFRIFLNGSNFHPDASVYLGGSQQPWPDVRYKGGSQLLLKKGASLKSMFPSGVPVEITVVNGDGGTAVTFYTRP